MKGIRAVNGPHLRPLFVVVLILIILTFLLQDPLELKDTFCYQINLLTNKLKKYSPNDHQELDLAMPCYQSD